MVAASCDAFGLTAFGDTRNVRYALGIVFPSLAVTGPRRDRWTQGVLFEEKSRARIHTSRPDNRCVAFSILFVFVGAIKFQEGLVGHPL